MQQPRGVSWTPEADNTGLPQSSHHLPPLQPAPSPTLQPPAPQNSIIPPPGLCLRNAGFESCPTPSTRAPGLCPARSPHSRPPPQHGGGRLPSRHLSSPHLTSPHTRPPRKAPRPVGPAALILIPPRQLAGGRPGGSTRHRPSPAQPQQARLGEKGGRRPRAAPTLRAAPPPPLPSFTPAARPLAGG